MAKCKYCGAEVTIGERCTYCGSKAESWYYPVAEKAQEPYRRADVWHNWLDRYVKKTICNECLKKYDVGGKQ